MSNLNVFEALDFVDKVNYLEKINQEKEISAIPILFELCSKSHLDPLIESMILESLQALLIYNEEKAVHGLSHSNKKVKKVCLRVICEKKYSRAVTHLISLIQETKDQNFLADILFALSEFRNDELLPLFQKYIHHDDSVISTLAISMIGIFQDKTSIDLLCNIIENGELGENVLKCELNIGAAIEALMLMNDEKAFSFLVSKLHYKNLTGRYILHREFVKLGDRILPYIARVLNSDDVDHS